MSFRQNEIIFNNLTFSGAVAIPYLAWRMKDLARSVSSASTPCGLFHELDGVQELVDQEHTSGVSTGGHPRAGRVPVAHFPNEVGRQA